MDIVRLIDRNVLNAYSIERLFSFLKILDLDSVWRFEILTQIDPKVELEIEKAKNSFSDKIAEAASELKTYSDRNAEKARNNALAVLGLVTVILSIGGTIGINSLVGNRAKDAIETKVDEIVTAELPIVVPQALVKVLPEALSQPIASYLGSDQFNASVESSLSSAVQSEFQQRVPAEVVSFIESQQQRADELVAQLEEQRRKAAESDELPFSEIDFRRLADDAVAGSWAPAAFLGQIQAQATCTALARTNSWVTAVPRTCSGDAPTCAEICGTVSSRTEDSQVKTAAYHQCTGSLHIYENTPADAADQVGLKTYKYDSCDQGSCGPNYCCCSSF